MNYKKLWYLFLCIPLHSIIQTAQSSTQLTQSEKNELLIRAIINNNTQEAVKLLELGANSNTLVHQESLLFLASKKGNDSIVRALLTYGADPRKQANPFTSLPLHEAVRSGHLECVKMLLNAAPYTLDAYEIITHPTFDGSELSQDCKTTLVIAIESNKTQVAEFLLKNGANLYFHTTDTYNPTVLHLATRKLNFPIVNELLKHSFNPNGQTFSNQRETPLHIAAKITPCNESERFQKELIIKLLLAYGASLESKNWNGATPVDCEKKLGDSTFLQEYVACFPNAQDNLFSCIVKKAYDVWRLEDQPEMLIAILGLVPNHSMNTQYHAVERVRGLFDPEIFDGIAAQLSTTLGMTEFGEENLRNRLEIQEISNFDFIKTKILQELKQ